MKSNRIAVLVGLACLYTVHAHAAPLSCVKPGKERWPIKTTLPSNAKTRIMDLTDALALQRLTNVKTNDPRYQANRILDQPVKEDTLVTISGYLYLVAFESDDCDFHIQISPTPVSSPPAATDNSMIVEIPSGEYATTISGQVESLRQWVIDNLLAKTPPKMGSVHVMQHLVYVTVTGALFYDDSHVWAADNTTGRGKKGLESKTLWELHPVTKISFARAPQPAQ